LFSTISALSYGIIVSRTIDKHGDPFVMTNRLTTKEAIESRRSIRKFKPAPVPDECIQELLEAARLAPSGCNAQPWRFKIIRDPDTKLKLAQAAHDQRWISEAPVVIVCCADIKGYLDGSMSGIQDLSETGAIEERTAGLLSNRISDLRTSTPEQIGPRIAFNVAIAVEHIILRALDFGLGTCWVRAFQPEIIKGLFDWKDNIMVVALLPLGYPDESPKPRKRRPLNELILE
jgi:nitroreductase